MSDERPSSAPESLPGDAFPGTAEPSTQVPPHDTELSGAVFQGVATSEQAIASHIPPTTAEMPAPASRGPRMLSATRHRDFTMFWAGNFLSNVGTWMQNVAQGWLVLDLADKVQPHLVLGGFQTNGAFWLGLVGFAASAPMLVFALIGGVIADRVNRRDLMVRTQTAMMIFAFIMAALAYTHVINIAEIILLAFANGLASSLNAPSQQALVPRMIPKEDLANAIALNSAQFNLSRLIGPAIGGFIMAWLGIPTNFLLNGISFLALIFVLRKIHYPSQAAGNGSATLWQNLAEGFRYVFMRREMSALLTLVGLASILGVPFITFIPLFAKDILHAGERGLGILMAFAGLGAFLGSITVAWMGRAHLRGSFVVRAATLFFVAIISFTFSRNFFLSGALLVVAGYAMILMVATVNTLLQHLSSEGMRGRVMSFYAMAFLGFAPIGSLIAGSLAGAITAPYALAGMCAVALIATWLLYSARPELRKLS